MERFDPGGSYVRRYVPELRAVPDEYLRRALDDAGEVQRALGCVIGEDYPGRSSTTSRRARGAGALRDWVTSPRRVRQPPGPAWASGSSASAA